MSKATGEQDNLGSVAIPLLVTTPTGLSVCHGGVRRVRRCFQVHVYPQPWWRAAKGHNLDLPVVVWLTARFEDTCWREGRRSLAEVSTRNHRLHRLHREKRAPGVHGETCAAPIQGPSLRPLARPAGHRRARRQTEPPCQCAHPDLFSCQVGPGELCARSGPCGDWPHGSRAHITGFCTAPPTSLMGATGEDGAGSPLWGMRPGNFGNGVARAFLPPEGLCPLLRAGSARRHSPQKELNTGRLMLRVLKAERLCGFWQRGPFLGSVSLNLPSQCLELVTHGSEYRDYSDPRP